MKEKILVIGGAGYLGSVLVARLLESGYPVRILDSFIYGKNSIKKLKTNKNVEIIVGDPASKARPEQTVETNFLAAQAISSACKLNGIEKFIYASTCSVYGVGS